MGSRKKNTRRDKHVSFCKGSRNIVACSCGFTASIVFEGLGKTYEGEKNMMISLRIRGGDTFYLNVDLIESIIEREGNTSEIRLTNGKIYSSIESPDQLANRVTRAQMSSELAKPKEGIYANSLR